MKPVLIVTVDVEEEGLWGNQFRPSGNTVQNVKGLGRFQDLCDAFDVRPSYLLTAPVVNDDRSVKMLGAMHGAGRCEIGAHLHPWCTPPLDGSIKVRDSFMCNLPEETQRVKLQWLTDEIETKFSERPTSFRAGRYGLDAVGAHLLVELGYRVDSSVVPFYDYSEQDGPDFSAAPYEPYCAAADDLCRPADDGMLLEVPVSVGFSHPDFARAQTLRHRAGQGWMRSLRTVGILDRLGIARRIKFSPEPSDSARLRQLADVYVAKEAPVLVLMLHSSSLLPGFSPYAETQRDLDELYRRLNDVFDHCLNRHALQSTTLGDFAVRHSTVQPATTHAV